MFGSSGETRERRPFKMSTKKIEWMLAAGRDPYEKFCKTSKCRRCKRKLTWGDRGYDFDHRDNNPANRSQDNCYLVCKTCHGKATKLVKRPVRGGWFGEVVGYETVKKRVGYKKGRRLKTARTKTKSAKAKPSKAKRSRKAKSKTTRQRGTKSRAAKTRRRKRT